VTLEKDANQTPKPQQTSPQSNGHARPTWNGKHPECLEGVQSSKEAAACVPVIDLGCLARRSPKRNQPVPGIRFIPMVLHWGEQCSGEWQPEIFNQKTKEEGETILDRKKRVSALTTPSSNGQWRAQNEKNAMWGGRKKKYANRTTRKELTDRRGTTKHELSLRRWGERQW